MNGAIIGARDQARHCEKGRSPDVAISWHWQEVAWKSPGTVCFVASLLAMTVSPLLFRPEAPTHA